MKKPKELRRRDVGFAVYGGTNFPICCHLIYQVDWDDGTQTMERGLTLHSLPGILPSRARRPLNVRPDLAPAMRAIQALLDPISHACLELDGQLASQKRKKSRGKKARPRTRT